MSSSKSWRGPRVVIGLIAATLSLVYFATLVWGPDSADDDSTKNYLKELGDEPKVEVSGPKPVELDDDALGILIPLDDEPELSRAQQEIADQLQEKQMRSEVVLVSAGLRDDEVHRMDFLVRDARTQSPLAGAMIEVARAAGSRSTIAELCADDHGKARVRRVPHAQYRYAVTVAGYHPATPAFVEVPVDGTRFVIDLEPAAQIVGVIEDQSGQVTAEGILHLRLEGESKVQWLEPDAMGRIFSPPLAEGTWHIAWMTDRKAQPAPGMTASVELPAGQRSLLEVVLPRGEVAADGRHAGIRLAQVTL